MTPRCAIIPKMWKPNYMLCWQQYECQAVRCNTKWKLVLAKSNVRCFGSDSKLVKIDNVADEAVWLLAAYGKFNTW